MRARMPPTMTTVLFIEGSTPERYLRVTRVSRTSGP
jgi:hypothetical protein